jgi:hypothetical protein
MKLFDIFIKKSTINLDCFINNPITFKYFPISNAVNFIPKWWKNIPKNYVVKNEYVDYVPGKNMKGCPGLTEFYKQGIIVPLWSDLIIKTNNKDYFFQFADQSSEIISHDPLQHNNSFNNFFHLKLYNPWRFKTKEHINFFITSPCWNTFTDYNLTNNCHTISGVLEFKFQHSCNVNIFLTKNENRFELNAGFPLVYLFPKTEKQIKINNHLIDDLEYKKLFDYNQSSFNYSYKKNKIYLKET